MTASEGLAALGAALARWAVLPFRDLLRGQAHCLARVGDLAWMLGGLAVGWWSYVPLHELLHAFACMAAGGSVSRLEVAPLYGGTVLAAIFPWVVAESDYAGRLAEFDTGGSDLVYLATDLGPFLLVLLPGVWAMRRAARARRPAWFGAATPFAMAPFLSLTGDAYEIGSIVVTQLPPWQQAADLLRGDDVARVAEGLAAELGAPWSGFVVATALGVLWAFATYGLGAGVARLLGQRALPPAPPAPAPVRPDAAAAPAPNRSPGPAPE